MLMTYDQFVEEMWGVVSRAVPHEDTLGISRIVNKFMDEISKNPNKKYTMVDKIEGEDDYPIKIEYNPIEHDDVEGFTNGTKIDIYKKLQDDTSNYLDVKYTLIHELVHVLQNIKKKRVNLDKKDRIRYRLIKPTMEQLSNDVSKPFTYLFYREDLYETFAWFNNAYLEAFKLKIEHSDFTDSEISKIVMLKIKMSDLDLVDALNFIDNNEKSFNYIIPILIGHFSELDGNYKEQKYFDKDIYKLPVILKMRQDVKKILTNSHDEYRIIMDIVDLIKKYKSELLEVKDEIMISFEYYIRKWFKEMRARTIKSILLGIEDATTKINE